jgi:hypothetical protein
MKRISSNIAWWLGGIAAHAALNSSFFIVVVGMDVVFHAAPQFVVPLFVPALCAVTGMVTILVRRARRPDFARGGTIREQATGRAAGAILWRSAPALHSAVVIRRRNSTNNSNAHERRAYASTV